MISPVSDDSARVKRQDRIQQNLRMRKSVQRVRLLHLFSAHCLHGNGKGSAGPTFQAGHPSHHVRIALGG
jgi:hypothetical protein